MLTQALIPLTGAWLGTASPIFLPVIALACTGWYFFRELRRRSEGVNIFEIGVFYSTVVLLYALYPSLTYLIGGMEYSVISDNRLYSAQPTPPEVGSILWLYALYFASFVFFYLRFRGRRERLRIQADFVDRPTFRALILTLVGIKVFFLLIRLVYGLQAPESYLDTYLMYKDLPQFLQQVLNHFGGMVFTLEILLAAVLVANYRKYKYWILAWIAVDAASLSVGGVGSRTGLFVLLLGVMVSYHFLHKPLRTRTAVLLGSTALVVFVVLGFVRAQADNLLEAQMNPFSSVNEFESIFGNAYDIAQLKKQGQTESVFPEFYVADFFALIPQQIVPFQKVDVAVWYAKTFYPEYAENGGGFAFGAIAESALGLGWFDALWRGAIVGVAFGWLFAFVNRRPRGLWGYAFYIWVLIFSYQCFRGTTFALLPRAFYQFLLLAIWIRLLAQILTLFTAKPLFASAGVAVGGTSPAPPLGGRIEGV